MKRSSNLLAGVHNSGPKTSDNSTSTGSHMKRIKRDGSRPKQLRRGTSHASSAQEYMKSEWTSDELDLNKQINSISGLAQDKFKLVEELFSTFSILELKEFTPDILKEYSINQLKELCLEELNSISNSKIKFLTEGNDPKDYVEPVINIDDKAIGDPSDGFQLSVDDNEYSDFLGAENLESRMLKKGMKDVEVQANWSSFESSSSDDSHSDHRDGEGWMNIWKLEQMEILELEMRARAIRMLLKQQDEEGAPDQKASDETTQTCDQINEITGDEEDDKDLEAGEIADTIVDDANVEHNKSSSHLNEDNRHNSKEKTVLNMKSNDGNEEHNSLNKPSINESASKEDNNEVIIVEKAADSDKQIEIQASKPNEIQPEGHEEEIVDLVQQPVAEEEKEIILVNTEFDEELDQELDEKFQVVADTDETNVQ